MTSLSPHYHFPSYLNPKPPRRWRERLDDRIPLTDPERGLKEVNTIKLESGSRSVLDRGTSRLSSEDIDIDMQSQSPKTGGTSRRVKLVLKYRQIIDQKLSKERPTKT